MFDSRTGVYCEIRLCGANLIFIHLHASDICCLSAFQWSLTPALHCTTAFVHCREEADNVEPLKRQGLEAKWSRCLQTFHLNLPEMYSGLNKKWLSYLVCLLPWISSNHTWTEDTFCGLQLIRVVFLIFIYFFPHYQPRQVSRVCSWVASVWACVYL